MTVNLVLMKENTEVLGLSKRLGFEKTWFLEKDFVLVEGRTKKEVLKKINQVKKRGLFVVVRAGDEEMLRFVLEKTQADMVLGQEVVCMKDSAHFRRGGLDQVLCKIAASRGKVIGFSFGDVLNSVDRGKLVGRMMFNLKLCKKYKVSVFLGNFSRGKSEMRSAQDCAAFWRVLGGAGKESLEIK